ncbi:TlpA disulfide reductase family protein [Flavobacterium antarcticum]|uniref:TlpA family protein disulfide reductase n=1 Tax=Flavobacterium antarcticum TaxID=271155 RepID=UPI0003B4180E|nr:TlpA disulfide reductase family protein [Flavobacterium antarcticum]
MNSDNNSKPLSTKQKAIQFIKKHGGSLLMVIAFVTIMVNPDAKAWVLQKIMLTGIFNAKIENESTTAELAQSNDFDFVNQDGTVQNTIELRGKVVFINFWASWCGPCRAEFPSIEKLYSKFKDNPNVYFLMINQDKDISKAKNYMENEQFSFPLQTSNSYIPYAIYTGSLPTTVVLDKKGKIRFHHENFANYASEKFSKQMEDLLAE